MIAASTLCAGAAAQPGADGCSSNEDRTACFVPHQAETLDLFGLPTAESRAAEGDSIRRVMVVGPWGNPIIAVEFRRAPAREPTVSLYSARVEGELGNEPALIAAVPLAEWDRLSRAGAFFDRTLAPLPPRRASNVVTICGDGETNIIETTDPDAMAPGERLRRRAAHECSAGLTDTFADTLTDAALRLLPACAGLPDRGPGNHAYTLRDCAMLDGDRMAAAEVFGQLDALRHSETPERIRHLFGRDSVLAWNGERSTGGQAAASWVGHRAGPQGGGFFPARLYGQTGRRVRLTGFIERGSSEADGVRLYLRAPVEILFVNPPGQAWQIERATIGAFAPGPAPRYPLRTATGGGDAP
jgi:hypothetical protein